VSRRDLEAMFARARSEDRAVLMPYMMAGIPDPAASVEVFEAMAEAGADAFEVGIPYADPLMDGPVIQRAGAVALAAGTTVDGALEILAEVRRRTGLPCIPMCYVNPILRRGPDRFTAAAADAGASALIVPDLPVDEAAEIAAAAGRHRLGMVLFAAPTTTDARLARLGTLDPVFVYGIAEMGVTGERAESGHRAEGLAARVRAVTRAPLVLGVGISTPEQAADAAGVADGVIVGSALVRRVLEAPDGASARASVSAAVRDLRTAVGRPAG
jgi:tryptophan synthase alpha chain